MSGRTNVATVSHHLLRRRARAAAAAHNARCQAEWDAIQRLRSAQNRDRRPVDYRYVVERAIRGPWRWRVVRFTVTEPR